GEDKKDGGGAGQNAGGAESKPAEAAAATAPGAGGGKKAEQAPATGAIEGKVTLEGPVPEVKPPEIRPDHQDKAACQAHLKQEKVILSDKKELKDVVVSVSKYKPAEKPKPREVTLENKNCTFVPHVQAVTAGSNLKITNSDAFLHNSRGVLSLSFNNAIAAGQSVEKPLKKPGWGVVSCDVHAWMQAHIWVFEHDLFDVTGVDGTFKIPNVPPGEYEIDVWHEYPLKAEKVKVKVEAGKTAKLDVALK